MKWFLALTLAGTATAAAAQDHGTPLSAAERTALSQASQPLLADQRAGGAERTAGLQATDRAALRSAQSLSPELAELRAGGLSDHEIAIIAITAGAVLLLILLL